MEPLRLRRRDADILVPDGASLSEAMARTTDVGIGAHPDDLEFLCIVPIGECLDDPSRWFTGVTCTDGAGSARGGRFASCSDDELVAIRREEQREAAQIGRYSAVVQLGHPSAEVRSTDGHDTLVDELASLLASSAPVNVYTHDLADKHETHVAVAAATVEAVRRLPLEQRPSRLVGIEGWRSLDWLLDGEKLRLDASPYTELAQRLAAVYASQIEGSKRYDVAEEGRRRANATLHAIREADAATEVVIATDLTSLVRNAELDPVTFVAASIERFGEEVRRSLRHWFS